MVRITIATLALTLWACPSIAQVQSVVQGTVRYEVRQKAVIGELPPEAEHLRSQLETETTMHHELQFAGSAAITRAAPARAEQAISETASISNVGARSVTFVDVDQEVRVSQIEFMDRTFLIEEPLKSVSWRLDGETSTYLGYEVHRASAETASGGVEAWFAPEIPVPVGPGTYGGLPGLILLVVEDGGRRTFTAQEVDLSPLASAPTPPREGRPVTPEEYGRIQQEVMERLDRTSGGGATIIRPN